MRLVIMRHGETINNVLAAISTELYIRDRTPEPELSEKGVSDCRAVGEALKSMKLHIDYMFTSPHKRAILSAMLVRETFKSEEQDLPEIGMIFNIHEMGGVHKGIQGFPGLTSTEAKALLPELVITEEQVKEMDEHNGWWKCRPCEKIEECLERAKIASRDLRAMAADEKYNNKTVFAVSHGAFIHTLMCVFNGYHEKASDMTFVPWNNSLMIVDFKYNQYTKVMDPHIQTYNH